MDVRRSSSQAGAVSVVVGPGHVHVKNIPFVFADTHISWYPACMSNETRLARINVVGSSGSGKTTFARKLAAQLGSPCIEMDAVFWEPGWKQPSDEVFFARLAKALDGERWVLDGNYDRTTGVKWPRTQLVIWLDYSLSLKLRRVTWRTLSRMLTREELWPGTGNRESPAMLFSRENIILFAYRAHSTVRKRYDALIAHSEPTTPPFIRLRSPGEADRFLAQLG